MPPRPATASGSRGWARAAWEPFAPPGILRGVIPDPSRPVRIGNCSGFFGDRISAAAELVVASKAEREMRVARPARALRQALQQRVAELRSRLAEVRSAPFLKEPSRLTERLAQRVDTLEMRMDHAARQRIQEERQRPHHRAPLLTARDESQTASLIRRLPSFVDCPSGP